MSIEVKPIIHNKKELKKYVDFGIKLYEGNDCFVPPLRFDEVDTLLREKNPAYDFCEAQAFMAYKDGEPVGRITAIINHAVNERTGKNAMRFGFVDFIDDKDVVDKLFEAVETWGRQRGMDEIVGPMGFSDMDHEGMLIDGFNELGTMATIYNHAYYPTHMDRLGFVKDADWVEFRIAVPDKVPDKYQRIADIVQKKYNLKVLKFTSRKKIKEQYGRALFELINESYDNLYGYSPLTDRQIEHYIDMYIGILRLEDVSVIVDAEDKLVGVGISMPSFSRALQKSNGRLFPFGWWHLLKALRGKVDTVDLMLIAIKPEYQSKGVNALLFCDLLPGYIRNGYKWAESNIELEDNSSVQLQWQYFDYRQHRRRRAYRKAIKK